jgi:hypothetical protein
MGAEMPNQNVYDVGPGQLNSPDMFETDSQDTLGTATELPLTSAPQVRMD